jgi:tight adherence protein B
VNIRKAFASIACGVAVFLVSWPATAGAASADAVTIREVNAKAFPSVAVTVSVSGNVSSDSIALTENGQRVDVLSRRAFSQTGRAFDVILAIDTSDSVAGAPESAAVQAALRFVQGLPSSVPVGVLTFSDQVRVLQSVTPDHSAAIKAIQSIKGTHQGTALYDAVGTAAHQFSGSAQHNIVLLSDGADVGSRHPIGWGIAAARRLHVGVFTVGLGSQADVPVLRQIADQTGSGFLPAVESNLSSIYASLAHELSNQYVLVYRSHGAPGAQVTVGARTAAGTDQSIVLLPAAKSLPVPGPEGAAIATHGSFGLAIALALSFIAVFAVLLLSFGSGIEARRNRALARRMSAPGGVEPGSLEDRRAGSPASWMPQPVVQAAESLASAAGVRASLDSRLERAAAPITAGEFLVTTAAAGVVGAFVGFIVGGILISLVLLVVGSLLPYMLLRRKESKRVAALHEQLPEVLMILASSLRAGHSFLQALDTVAKEIGDPSAPEFARVVAEVRLGRPAYESLAALAERVGTEEFKWAMLGINVQREVGGNLAEILDTLAQTVRERDAVRRQVKVLSAEARLSMKIMVALPPLLTLYIVKVNPSYMRLLWTTRTGWFLITGAVVLLVGGVLMMRKIVRIDV